MRFQSLPDCIGYVVPSVCLFHKMLSCLPRNQNIQSIDDALYAGYHQSRRKYSNTTYVTIAMLRIERCKGCAPKFSLPGINLSSGIPLLNHQKTPKTIKHTPKTNSMNKKKRFMTKASLFVFPMRLPSFFSGSFGGNHSRTSKSQYKLFPAAYPRNVHDRLHLSASASAQQFGVSYRRTAARQRRESWAR